MMSSKTKKFSALCSIMALLMATPLPTHQVWAQQEQQQESTQTPGGDIWGAIMGITNQIAQQQMAANQQAQQMQQMQQVMQAMSFQPVPSKYFGCMVPKTLPETPVGFCEPSAGAGPFQFEMMQNISQAALLKVRRYDQMLTPAQNSPTPTGLRCLEDGKKSVISSMVQRQNSLQSLIDKLKKEAQSFRAKHSEILQKMDDLHAELHGGQTGTNKNGTLNFASQFSPECQEIIGTEQFAPERARAEGLLGIVENLRPKQELASDYRSNEANYERSFERLTSKLASDIEKNGITGVIAEVQGGGYEVRGFRDEASEAGLFNFNDTLAKRADILQRKREVIQRELQGILGNSFTLPQTTRHFTEDFDRFIQRADSFYKKKFVSDCVTGADSSDLSLNLEQLLRSLEQPSTNTRGIAHLNYRNALENILAQDSHIEDKMGQIRALDRRFDNEITVRYRTADSNLIDATPYEIFQRSIAACEAEFELDKTHSTEGEQLSGAGSRKAEVERAKKLMQEYKNDVQDFETTIVGDIEHRVRSCEGHEVTKDSCSKEGIFKMNNPNFCFKNASSCSRKVMACYRQAEKHVDNKKRELKKLAGSDKNSSKAQDDNSFNGSVRNFVTRQEQILSDVKNQVLADAEFLKEFFPGADYKYPEDLFVKMPQLQQRNGELIYGGGEINYNDVAENVEKLKTELANQSDKIDQVVSEYINDQKNQMQKNRNTLQQVADQCRSAAQRMAEEQQKQQTEQMQQQQEANAEAGDFCRKFNSLASTENPAAGCSGPFSPENLYEDVAKVSAHIDNRVSGAIGDYMALCNQSQNERKNGTEDQGDSNRLSLAEACKEGVFSLQDRIVNQTLDNLPSELEGHRGEIEDYLLGSIDSSELSSSIRDSSSIERLTKVKVDIESDRDEAKERLQEILDGKELKDNLKKKIVEKYEENVRDERDRYCSTQVLRAAQNAIDESNFDSNESNQLNLFEEEFEEQMKDRDSNYKRASRSIASVPNAGLTQRWQDIGQAVGENCAATANNSRGSSGFMDSNMGLGSDVMRNLGLSPR